MANRKARKERQRARRLHRLALLSLALSVAVLILVLILRPRGDEGETFTTVGDGMWDGSWYEDDLGCIEADRTLVRAMKTFEKKTGVMPYLSLQSDIDPEELTRFARQQYEALFSEGDHLLVVYDEWGEETYYLAAETGRDSALTPEETARLLRALESAYADRGNETYADAFAAGFRQGGRQIAAARGQSGGTGLLIALGVVLLILGAILIVFLRKRTHSPLLDDGEDG